MQTPIFVVGAQRSGTTLVGLAVAHHPAIAMTVNGKVIYYLIHWVLRARKEFSVGHCRLDEVVHGLLRRPILGVPSDSLASAIEGLLTFRAAAKLSAVDYVRAIVAEFYSALATDRAQYFGDKYNEYLLCLPELEVLFPEARYVFVVRSPLEVATSAVRAFRGRPWAPVDTAEALHRWAKWNSCWIKAGIPKARAFVVRYEDLVRKPRETYEELFSWLLGSSEPQFLDDIARMVRLPEPYFPDDEALISSLTGTERNKVTRIAQMYGYALDGIEQ